MEIDLQLGRKALFLQKILTFVVNKTSPNITSYYDQFNQDWKLENLKQNPSDDVIEIDGIQFKVKKICK